MHKVTLIFISLAHSRTSVYIGRFWV